jgi:oligopeptide transport system substrate-binding protein
MLKSWFATLLILGFSVPAFGQKVLRYSEDGAPTNLDPVASATQYTNIVVTAIFDTLYEYKYLKRPYELKPNLAEGFPEISKDGLTYKFKIKKGVYFADDPAFKDGKGREVIADDFVYSIKRHFDPKERSQGEWLWQGKIVGLDEWKKSGSDYSKEIPGLKALDRYTIQITTIGPFPQLLYTLAMGYSAFVPREAVEKYKQEFSVKPVGSGPFMLKSHNTTKTVLLRNPKYRDDKFDPVAEGYVEAEHGKTGIKALAGKKAPIVDEVQLEWIKEQVARWNSFTKGNETVWAVLQPEQLNEVVASKNPIKLKPAFESKYHHRVNQETEVVYNFFNMDDPRIGTVKDPKQNERNKALRCAIRKGFDWQQRIDRFYLGIGKAFPGIIPPGSDGFDPNMDQASIKLDVEGAKKLLGDNGWSPASLPTLEYSIVSSVKDRQFYEQFRGFMEKIGYPKNKITLKTYATFGDYNKDIKSRKTMMIGMAWGLDYPDAENVLGLLYGPNASPGSNSSNYDNPEFNALFKKASAMQPSKERTEYYKQLNKIMIDDCVAISGFSRTRIFMWHKNAIMWPERNMIGGTGLKYMDVN